MAATVLTVQPAVETGLEIAYATPTQTTGHTAPCGGGTALLVKNGDIASADVTLVTPGTFDGLAIADRTVTVAAGKDELIPLPADLYAASATGLVTFNLTSITSISLACVRVS